MQEDQNIYDMAPVNSQLDTDGQPRLIIKNEDRGLHAKNLGKRFKKRPVVHGASLSIQRGEVVG